MKKTTKLVSILLVLVMFLSMAPISVFAAENVASGDCGAQGNNATWTLDSDGVLIISGTGSLGTYTYFEPAPWYDYRESIKQVIVSEGVTSLGSGAFRICESLTEVTLPSTLKDVGGYSFFMCSSLTEIDIPYGVTSIGDDVFFECTALEKVTLPGSLESIGEDAFYGCETLAEIIIPDSVTSLGEYVFYGCKSLKKATLSNNLKTIPEYAFADCSSLEEITVHDGVTSIGDSAFSDCSALATVSLPNSVTTIGDFAFDSCSSLEEITIPDKLTSLNYNVFRSCSKLAEVTIPPSVTSISSTFPFCSGLREITILGNVTSVAENAFSYCNALETVNLPCEWDETLYTFDSNVKINQHNWINKDGVCADCDYECTHASYSGNMCGICGVPHTHSFEYTAGSDGVIVETCVEDGCTLENGEGGKLTISAPEDLYADGTAAREATVENNLIDTSVAIGDITYSTEDGNAPKTVGTYTANITVGGATASVEFTLLNYAATVTDKDGNELESSPYKTFAEAITAAAASEDSTVTLLDDVTVSECHYINSGKLTLDLNGKTLSSNSSYVLIVSEGAVLTIKDSGTNGKIQNKENFSAIVNQGTVTVESGSVHSKNCAINNGGTLNVKGGKISSETREAISNSARGTLSIYDGAVIESEEESAVQSSGTLHVYGGELSGNAAVTSYGNTYIHGGEFTGRDYACLNILGGVFEITGGTFTGTDFSNGYYSGTPYGEWTIDYTDGASIILKGGEFPNGLVIDIVNANVLIADGYYFRDKNGAIIEVADDVRIINGYVKITNGADIESEAIVTLDETEFTYSGKEHKPAVTVTVGGRTLTEGADYTVSYANNVNAGTATVTVTAVADGSHAGTITVDYTINKKPVTVTATAPDKVYDGTTDILNYADVIVRFDGAVEGEMIGFTVGKAWYDSADAGTDKVVHIIYAPVASSSIDNYEFPVNPEYSTDNFYVTATASITPKSIHDGFIILGDTLTYNGSEQIQTVDKVLTTNNLEATFEISGNTATEVGVYLLTVTGTGNFTGEAKLTYNIAVDTKCIRHIELVYVAVNGVSERRWTVKSTDRESLEYVLDQLNNAVTDIAPESKKERWNEMKADCEEILGIIDSIELIFADIEEDYAGFSEDTVKSSDIPALDELVGKINEFKDRYGYYFTEEEAKKLEDILDGIEMLKEKIAETEEKIEEIKETANSFSPENVSSDDKAEIEEILAEIADVNTDNLTPEQKAEYDGIKADLEACLAEIEADAQAVAAIGTELEKFDEDRVTIFWENNILALQAKIDEMLGDENMGDTEKAKLNEYRAQTEKLVEIINTPGEYFSIRLFHLIVDSFTWKENGIFWLFAKIFG